MLNLDGFLCVDKPLGPSSFNIVQAAKRVLKISKTGHAGTLDPMASGLLVIALGNCTRLLRYLSLEPKVYEFSVTFGKSTDTLDAEGNVIAESDVMPSESLLASILKNFNGDIEQIPPRYSAIKIGGKRAYQLARNGEDMEIKPRVVNICGIDLRQYDYDGKRADFTVSCSSGTYVRSLARDIAVAVGAEGFASSIRRIKTGRFDVSMAVDHTFTDIRSFDAKKYIIDTGDAFDANERVIITDAQKSSISNGREIIIDKDIYGDILIAFDKDNSLSAVLKRIEENRYHPEKVFI